MIDSKLVHNVFDEYTGKPLPEEEQERRIAEWRRANGVEPPPELQKPLWEAHNELVSKLQKFIEEADLKIAQLEQRVKMLERLNESQMQADLVKQTFGGQRQAAINDLQQQASQYYQQMATTCAIPTFYSTASTQPTYAVWGNPW